MNEPSVSVIVPAYNEEKHIEECLASIKNQTYPKIELVVVDDGSTDATKKIAKKYSDVFIIQKHQGPGTARNKAAKIAKGEILVFIDADMYLDKNYIKNIIKPIVERKAIATFTKEEYVANPDNIWSMCFQIDNSLPKNKRISQDKSNFDTKFRAISRTSFKNIGGYKEFYGYGEDHITSESISFVAKGSVCYHFNPDTLKDVFLSARWMGRSVHFKKNLKNLFRYSLINSITISFKKIKKDAPMLFLVYKIIFDFGILSGILNKNAIKNFSK